MSPTDRMMADLSAVCDCGGRLAGTASERAAVALLARLGREATGVGPRVEPVAYAGWRATKARLVGPDGSLHPVHPLVRSAATPPEGIEAEAIVLARGLPEEFEAHRPEIAGRIVVVPHELMFSAGTHHRRLKYRAAVEAGAAGFLVAGPAEGLTVAGSSGRGAEPGIPAAGIAPETARALARTPHGFPKVRLRIATEEARATADNLIFDLPGRTDELVVLSAHIDGHDLGESAIDNASGLAVALEVARRVAAGGPRRRGLRLAFFNVEEWALTGSAAHVDALPGPERARIALVANLDSVAGGSRLTALTSGFPGLDPFLLGAAAAAEVPLGLYRPLQANSDHANFARAGIPAFRLVAGFGEPDAAARLVLTPLDRRGLVAGEELARAASLAAAILEGALDAAPDEAAGWRAVP